jgi:hypothetical protein
VTIWFWIILGFALLCIFACSMEAFERRWARAFVCGLFAVNAFVFLSFGWVS